MSFVDQFPYDPSAKSFAAHQIIDEDLRSAGSLRPETPFQLRFPGCFQLQSPEREDLLAAALERLEWHHDHPDPRHSESADALTHLAAFLGNMLIGVPGREPAIDEDTLQRLIRLGPVFWNRQGGTSFHNIGQIAAKTLDRQRAPLAPEAARSLISFVDHLVAIHFHGAETYTMAYRLYREGWVRIPWIQNPPASRVWSELLDLADHDWQDAGFSNPKVAEKLAGAVTKVGDGEVANFIQETVSAMAELQPTPMCGAGMTVLRQMLRWIWARPHLKVDDALYRLSGLHWNPAVAELGLMKEWLGTFLVTLTSRGRDQAFACLEQLANNPDTKEFREVRSLYEQTMRDLLLDVPTPSFEGVDGFRVEGEQHRILENMLAVWAPRRTEPDGRVVHSTYSNRNTHVEQALRRGKDDYPALLRAMNERTEWIRAHEPPPSPAEGRRLPWLMWACDLGSLYHMILKTQPSLTAEDLIAICRVDGWRWLGCTPCEELFAACERRIEKNGFDPALTSAMRLWAKSVYGGGSAQALRKRIEWLLWFDTEAPVSEKPCWSGLIHQDLRRMEPGLRGKWIALLGNVAFGIAEKPTKKWLKPAEKLLKGVGAEEFRSRFRDWFAPFREGGEWKLTVTGRDILGALLWYAQLAKDPAVDEAVCWFATAKWKTKADLARTARLLPMWIYTLSERSPDEALDAIHRYRSTGQLDLTEKSLALYKALCKRYGRTPEIAPPPPPPPFDKDAWMAKQMSKLVASPLGGSGTLEGESLRVANPTTGEEYEIELRGGRIVRQSDGKVVRLEIDWSNPPFSFFKGMIDARDLIDPLGPNYQRAILCAQVLSGVLQIEVPIVVDES